MRSAAPPSPPRRPPRKCWIVWSGQGFQVGAANSAASGKGVSFVSVQSASVQSKRSSQPWRTALQHSRPASSVRRAVSIPGPRGCGHGAALPARSALLPLASCPRGSRSPDRHPCPQASRFEPDPTLARVLRMVRVMRVLRTLRVVRAARGLRMLLAMLVAFRATHARLKSPFGDSVLSPPLKLLHRACCCISTVSRQVS